MNNKRKKKNEEKKKEVNWEKRREKTEEEEKEEKEKKDILPVSVLISSTVTLLGDWSTPTIPSLAIRPTLNNTVTENTVRKLLGKKDT